MSESDGLIYAVRLDGRGGGDRSRRRPDRPERAPGGAGGGDLPGPGSLLTGLLGMGVGGIPSTENRLASPPVCALLFGPGGLHVWALRRSRWL